MVAALENQTDKMSSIHYNDWPNSQGFDTTFQEHTPVELQVEGDIPAYAAGTLFRTGLGPRTVLSEKGTFKVNHWFDNFASIHRFQIHAPEATSNGKVRVTYNSRSLTDGLIEKVRKHGTFDAFTFAAKYDPCKTFFSKLQSVFKPANEDLKQHDPSDFICAVTLSTNFPGLDAKGQIAEGPRRTDKLLTLTAKTDAKPLQMIDPETLEPTGIATQKTLHPDLKGPLSAAHAKSDPKTGDIFNYNLEFGGRYGTFRVFTVSAATGKTSILATIQDSATYIHSVFITENYVILCRWNSFYNYGGASILWTKNLMSALQYDGKTPAKWYIIDKKTPEQGGRGLVATYESDAFFCFHSINAYEEPNRDGTGVDIVADLNGYDSIEVLHRFYLENLMSDSETAKPFSDASNRSCRPEYHRYRFESIPSTLNTKPLKATTEVLGRVPEKDGIELAVLNPNYITRKHRYIYGVQDTGLSTFFDGLVKYDTWTGETIRWSRHGHTGSEPIFVPNPAADQTDPKHEDDGVLLSVILDGHAGKSYLLVLDAKNMQEIGKAHVEGIVGFAFHGAFSKMNTVTDQSNYLDF